MSAVSPQARRNRVKAGKKAAAFVRAARRDGRYGPQGSHRGSAPQIDSVDTIMRRLRALIEPQRG